MHTKIAGHFTLLLLYYFWMDWVRFIFDTVVGTKWVLVGGGGGPWKGHIFFWLKGFGGGAGVGFGIGVRMTT